MKGLVKGIARAEAIAAFLRDREELTPLTQRQIQAHFHVGRTTFDLALHLAHDRHLIYIADYERPLAGNGGGHWLAKYLAGNLPDAPRPPAKTEAQRQADLHAYKAAARAAKHVMPRIHGNRRVAPPLPSIDPFSAALFKRRV